MFVLDYRRAQPQFYENQPCPSDPAWCRARDRPEETILMQDGLTPQDAATDLVDLAVGVT